jgi:predicted aspartyl protease
MQLSLKDNLPFVNLVVIYKGQTVEINDVLIDTGSGTTVLASDIVQVIQITPSPEDVLYTIRGIGGSEVVFSRIVDALKLGECSINNIEVEIGGMDYGFRINGILGMDFLLRAGAIINLQDMKIEFGQ